GQGTRRFSVTGFGGQGKTYLALETGYWLLRTGLFRRVCFVSFSGFQGVDPKGVAISTLATVLEQSLPDADAAEQALKRIPTLLILDNLETLADGDGLPELLSTATRWSEAGESRVLLTSRQPDFNHPDYHTAGTFEHQCLHLKGLGQQDALDWFGELMRLPPEPKFGMPQRSALVDLFHKVDFHPLSIGLLAQQLKERRPAELGERLEALLEEQPADREDRSLLASLELSLERLPKRCREWLPRLGVFAGGGLEEIVVEVAGMEDYPREWSVLEHHLMLSGLIHEEWLKEENKVWLRFHPTLAPALWQKLNKEEQAGLMERYCQAYHQLSTELYLLDHENSHATRAVAKHELPNMLRAVYTTLQLGKIKKGTVFADCVSKFLDFFGMQRDYQELAEASAKTDCAVGSQEWYASRSNLGEQFWQSGQPSRAEQVFQEILKGLEETVSYIRCVTLSWLGRCCKAQGQPVAAERWYRLALSELVQLEQIQEVRRETSLVQTDLADVMREQGRYREAEQLYKIALKNDTKLDDRRGLAVGIGQLGTLARRQGKLSEAEDYFTESIALFRQLREPLHEAIYTHNLGLVYHEAQQWEVAEQTYREAARLFEGQGDARAGGSWEQLAILCESKGRAVEAEMWHRKALAAFQGAEDFPHTALTLSNLADLLAKDPVRLDEARDLAEKALKIKRTLDPAAVAIWATYGLLAQILAQQDEKSEAALYRAKSRQSYLAFSGWRQLLHQYEPLIVTVLQAVANPNLRAEVEQILGQTPEHGLVNLAAAILCLLSGERDEAALCEPLNFQEAAVIRAILEGIAEQE
ncbi:MAG: hypothetical protein D3911_12815, partial [Candidatus Electrothrix sp. AW3_4]|nr:hypothetical protein [Candidatus Electrothrix gigas]